MGNKEPNEVTKTYWSMCVYNSDYGNTMLCWHGQQMAHAPVDCDTKDHRNKKSVKKDTILYFEQVFISMKHDSSWTISGKCWPTSTSISTAQQLYSGQHVHVLYALDLLPISHIRVRQNDSAVARAMLRQYSTVHIHGRQSVIST